jgi:hypothetical protein
MTAVGTATIAVPNLAFASWTALKRGEAALGRARLAFRGTETAARRCIETGHGCAFLEQWAQGRGGGLKSSEVLTGLELGVAPERVLDLVNLHPVSPSDPSGVVGVGFGEDSYASRGRRKLRCDDSRFDPL